MESKMESLLQWKQEPVYFEGYITSFAISNKPDGTTYAKFSIPLKKQKDDAPEWLNCYIYNSALVEDFKSRCKNGSKVWLEGTIYEIEKDERVYVNYTVKDFKLLEYPKPKKEQKGE